PRWMNLLRSISSEGFGRLRYYQKVRSLLDTDRSFAAYFEQETTRLPPFYVDIVRKDLGPLWAWLPPGALDHDPTAWLESPRSALPPPTSRTGPAVRRPGLAPGILRPSTQSVLQ